MHFKKIIHLILILSFFSLAHANLRCDLASKLSDPKISSNLDFWEDFNKLQAKGKVSDREYEELFRKHGVDSSKPQAPSVVPSSSKPFNYSTTAKADKDLKKLPSNLRKQYEEFMSIMSDKDGYKGLYQNPGRWHLEKLKSVDGLHTVRLNGGYRVLFRKLENGIEVLEVNAAKVHAI